MNRTELAAIVAKEAGLTKANAKTAVDAMLAAIEGALANNETVALLGFGTFTIAERAERKGINPATGQNIVIPARKNIKFKAGSALNEKIK